MEIKGVPSFTQRNNSQITDYLKFKSDFEVVMKIYKIKDGERVYHLLAAVEGPVKKLLLEKKQACKNYQSAKAILRTEILGQNWVMKVTTEFQQIKQRSDEKITQFMDRFQLYVNCLEMESNS